MRILLICAIATVAHAESVTLPLVDDMGAIRFEIQHEYNADLQLIDSQWSWSADVLQRTITRDVIVGPAVFPELPQTESRTVTETLTIIAWDNLAKPTAETTGPYLDLIRNAFLFAYPIESRGELTVQRDLSGPLSNSSDIFSVTANSFRDSVRHRWAGEWVPEQSYVARGPIGLWIPDTMHDGVLIRGYEINNYAVVVPESIPDCQMLSALLLVLTPLVRARNV